jgi:hypothetical protein
VAAEWFFPLNGKESLEAGVSCKQKEAEKPNEKKRS